MSDRDVFEWRGTIWNLDPSEGSRHSEGFASAVSSGTGARVARLKLISPTCGMN